MSLKLLIELIGFNLPINKPLIGFEPMTYRLQGGRSAN
jgi:hypothetical protein